MHLMHPDKKGPNQSHDNRDMEIPARLRRRQCGHCHHLSTQQPKPTFDMPGQLPWITDKAMPAGRQKTQRQMGRKPSRMLVNKPGRFRVDPTGLQPANQSADKDRLQALSQAGRPATLFQAGGKPLESRFGFMVIHHSAVYSCILIA
jgi:hypothetical protein